MGQLRRGALVGVIAVERWGVSVLRMNPVHKKSLWSEGPGLPQHPSSPPLTADP